MTYTNISQAGRAMTNTGSCSGSGAGTTQLREDTAK